MRIFKKSRKLDNVLYDIRGPLVEEATRLEEAGFRILKLNTGNPPAFGFCAPDEITHDLIHNLNPTTEAYSESKGLFSARKAIMQYCQQKNIPNVDVDDIYTGNGASECIVMALQALLDDGDEVLVPIPDYPLWTAAVNLSGGKPVHYICDEQSLWYPDLADIRRKVTDRTKAIVVINPNNPTGALYPEEVLRGIIDIAYERNLVVFSDEIYDKIIYDGAQHVSTASLADDLLFITFNGLSKAYRVPGFRVGWMVISGDKSHARDYVEGIAMLAAMRLCSNVPGQAVIQTALGGRQSIYDLTAPGGRLFEQRNACYEALMKIPGISCVKPQAALYMFPRIDVKRYNITSDTQFMLDLLRNVHILFIQGTGFNWPAPDHFRIVFLPAVEELREAFAKIGRFLENYRQNSD